MDNFGLKVTMNVTDEGTKSKTEIGDIGAVETGKCNFSVGGDMENRGKFKSHDTDIDIKGSLLNEGDMNINDPEKIKETILEIARSAKNVTEIGKMFSEKFFGKQF